MCAKRLFALILSLIFVFSLSACQSESVVYRVLGYNENQHNNSVITTSPYNSNTPGNNQPAGDSYANNSAPQQGEEVTTPAAPEPVWDDPDTWYIANAVEYYKAAAAKSHSKVKSDQSITLKDISINNGELESVVNFVSPIMASLLENNSSTKDGITGGYANLVDTDIKAAKAYKVGNNIAIEFVLKDQVSGAKDDPLSGTVGHGITAVGDIGVVVDEMEDLGLPLEFPEGSIKIYYTIPIVKVLIDSDGNIINGTWSYRVRISMTNYKAFGKTVNSSEVIMDNKITVNGGFKV